MTDARPSAPNLLFRAACPTKLTSGTAADTSMVERGSGRDSGLGGVRRSREERVLADIVNDDRATVNAACPAKLIGGHAARAGGFFARVARACASKRSARRTRAAERVAPSGAAMVSPLPWTMHQPHAFLALCPVTVHPRKPHIMSTLRWLEDEGILDDVLFQELHLLTGSQGSDETIASHANYLQRSKSPKYRRGPVNRLGSLTCAVRIQVVARELGLHCSRQGGRLYRFQMARAVNRARKHVTPERVLDCLEGTLPDDWT